VHVLLDRVGSAKMDGSLMDEMTAATLWLIGPPHED